MSPTDYCQVLKDDLDRTIFSMLSEGDRARAECVINAGLDFIGGRLSFEYEDMTPKAVDDVEKLQGFLFAFIEHCFNPSLLKECDV